MSQQSYPCYYPGEFSPPTKYHLTTIQSLLNNPEIHRVNVVLGTDKPGQLSQEQRHELWDMLLKYNYAPQAGIIKAKQQGPISHIYETFNKDKNLPAYIALDEKSSRNMKLQEKFEQFPYFGIQIIPSQFHKSSKTLMSCAQDNDLEGVKRELPDGVSDDFVQKYIEIINKNRQDPEAPEENSPYVDHKTRYMNMFNDGFWKSVFQPMAQEAITEALKEDIKKKALEKFKRENNALTDQQIMRYINSFEKNMEKPIVKKKDILQYTWDELEQLVDGNFGTETISKAKPEDIVDFKGSEDVVYNQNGLLILLGDIREKCIRYGQKYTWCISRADANNMFYSYRMRMNEPVFYFIFDEDKIENNPNDKYHAIVIYVDSKGKYTVADSTNSGDEEMSWEEIVKIQPKLKDLKSLIKHIPLSAEEKADYEKYKDEKSDEEYKKYTYDEKYKYIQFGHDLTEDQIRNTPKSLLSRFIATGIATNLPDDLHDILSGSDKKLLFKNRKENISKKNKEDDDETIEKITKLYYYPKHQIEDLKTEQSLYFRNVKITQLPNNLEVGGDLDLSGTDITELSDNLKVRGNLYLRGTNITKLPDNLKVGENIYLRGTNVNIIPKNAKIGGYIVVDNINNITNYSNNLNIVNRDPTAPNIRRTRR